jgi:hypothetical protein
MAQSATTPASQTGTGIKQEDSTRKTSNRNRLLLYGAVAFFVALVAVLVWQVGKGAQEQRRFADERAKMSAEHTRELGAQAEQLLRTSGALLGMVLSAPLAAEDFATIENQIKGLIREKQILVVAVADKADEVRIATNHKLEGQRLDEAFPGLPQAGSSVTVSKTDGGLVAVIPVAEAGVSVGRAVILYRQED